MTINSVNIAYGASYGAYSQKLTQATKEKLNKLGIPYNQNMTEEEGKKLVQAAEVKNVLKGENDQSAFLKQNEDSKNELFERAKELAEKLGIAVEENADFTSLITRIESTIEQRLSISQNNISALKELQGYSRELADIQAQSNGSSGYNNTNQALMTSLEMLSEYNKNFLYNCTIFKVARFDRNHWHHHSEIPKP